MSDRERVIGTVYYIRATPVFASSRWRFEITTDGATGPVVVLASQGTYEKPEGAIEVGRRTARTMTDQRRRDLGR